MKAATSTTARACVPSRAFTLVELLAVLAIIMLLASLLVPALAAARKRASLPLCTSQLRQLYVLCTGYAGDNNNELPQGLSENPQMFNLNNAKFKVLNAYMKQYGYTPKTWYCPSLAPQFGNEKQWNIDQGGTPGEFPIGYFYVGNVTTGSLWKFKEKPPSMLSDFVATNKPFIWDICKAHRPSPINGEDVTDWWIFPHYGETDASVCNVLMGGGAVIPKRVNEIKQRYNYIHPGEIYW